MSYARQRHQSADGAPLVEAAEPGAEHLLELVAGPTAATSPALAVDLRVARHGVIAGWVWRAGERWQRLPPAGRA